MRTQLRVAPATLETADDAELAWSVIGPAYEAVNIYDGAEVLVADLVELTPGQRALLALHWCVSEVSNGGFDQFFTNPSRLLAAEALEGFERIGALESASVLREAVAIFASRPPEADPNGPAFDEADDAEAFDTYRARHALLEERFFELADRELYPRAAAYVRAHPAEFVQ